MYHFTELVDRDVFFKFPRSLVENKIWCSLPHASQAVYPAIGCFASKDGVSWPCEETIAAVCGLSEKTVRAGISALHGVPGLLIEPYVTSRGRRSKRFKFAAQPETRKSIPFHRVVIDGGNWRELLPCGRALYPILRFYGFYDADEIRLDAGTDEEFKELLAQRECDYCDAQISVLAEFAGLDRKSVYHALESVERCSLVVRDAGRWKVFRTPPKYFARDYLNAQLRAKR